MASMINAEALEVLKSFSTGMVGDALLMAGIEGGILGIHPVRGFEDAKIVGPATTVLFGPPTPDTPKMTMYRAIRSSAPGSVLVIDGKGLGNHFTGDNQGECAKRRGILGTVVYGGARDVAGYRRMGMPLWCMGAGTADKPLGFGIVGHNVPIEISGVQVKPGDIIVADEDGVMAIPQESLNTVLANLKVITEVEEGMEKAIQCDAPVEEMEVIIGRKRRKA
ncbi:MAG: RraA family protein [Candidatus Eisenbacteria bacterium]|nr:RraA family protein [Candidatus Eisenbacteria bacterium]